MSEKDKKPQPEWVKILAVSAGMLLVVFTLLVVVILAYPLFFRDVIYPGVHVQHLDVGGMTVDQARAAMEEQLEGAPDRTLGLKAPDRTITIDWAELGRHYDWAGTAKAAYRVGRGGPWYRKVIAAWRIRLEGQTVDPKTTPADPARVEAMLNDLAPQVYVAPTNATLTLGAAGVRCTPGREGRALDADGSANAVSAAMARGAPEAELCITALVPDLAEPEPGCTEAREILSEPFTMVVDDPLTGTRASFDVSPEEALAWLSPVALADRIELQIDETAIESWLVEIGSQLNPDVILDIEQTLTQAVAAVAAGDHRMGAVVRHPEETYVVQPGDTLFDIAYGHGFPVWRLEEANPEVEPGELLIGMELTIPSIDVLFPEPLAPGKRIEIDLPEQRLRAYEEDTLVYDFTCSSGMTSTPTIAGQFQVLFKEPEAYAQRWSLEMPYFMAIYYEGPDFANGIHELPIRADGQRLWASVLGWPASYGCIILDVGDAKTLYDWAPVGTLVRIKGVAPGTPSLP